MTLIATRPLTKKILSKKKQPTNADRNIGQIAVVTEEIENLKDKGAVKVNGVVWTAKNTADDPIPAGEKVRILRIEGVKLIVEKI